ncbi:hypothetical protein JB92DRAFT_1589207 [Gautieria morchelliformis]|nr:hypothetical protein JB92DRAFT_1589207 [Gautieria morchelliformis]
MASQQSMDIQVISDNLAVSYVDVATLALLAYDTLLTLPSEITYIWHRRVRLGTVLYLLARYPALLDFIFTVYLDIANIPLKVRWTVMGASIRHIPAQARVTVGDWSPWYSSVYGQFGYGSVSRSHRLSNVFVILFDTLVVVVTLYNTLGLVRMSREFHMLPRKSLSQTLAQQGHMRYGFILTIALAGVITTKVLRPSIAGILITVQDSLSVIIICRCHLALQERVAHPNGTTHSAHHPITSFRAAACQIHNSLMDEFGDPSIDEIGTLEAIEAHREDYPSSDVVAAIELEEIPCERELGSAVDTSSGEVCAEPQPVAVSMGKVSIHVHV